MLARKVPFTGDHENTTRSAAALCPFRHRTDSEREEKIAMESSEDFDSLFEGMVLIDTSSSYQPTISDEDQQPRQLQEDQIQSHIPRQQQHQQQPLDENLFSDLTLINATNGNDDDGDADEDEHNPIIQTPLQSQRLSSQPLPTAPSPARQTSRKKKRAVRIGYGRGMISDTKALDSPSRQPTASIKIDSDSSVVRESDDPKEQPSLVSDSVAAISDGNSIDLHNQLDSSQSLSTVEPAIQADRLEKEFELNSSNSSSYEDAVVEVVENNAIEVTTEDEAGESPIEMKLVLIRTQIAEKLQQIRETAAALSTARKETARKRRKAAENVDLASAKYKDLERQLEEACEAEDFERAESVSESLAAVEREKEGFLNSLREAETDCDSIDSRMQEVLELQLAAEEEGIMLLQQFSKDAADKADLVFSNAEELSSKEMEEWQSSTEAIETKKVELDIESHLINEARSELKDFIEHSVEDDLNEKELLCKKQNVLIEELDKLLVLVRTKEAEIAANKSSIEEIEKRIANAVSGFHEAQFSIDTKYDELQLAISQTELESEALSNKKKEIDEFLSQREEKRSQLRELVSVSADEAKERQEFVGLRKNLAAAFLNSRKDRVRLAKTEEKISEDVQVLRQQVSAARASLQELSSTRASIQQEIASSRQRISFIEKRGPELEAEKKVAAAARNFKEAGRIAAEARSLSMEKEDLQNKMERAISGLDKVEEEMKETVNKLQENEVLILSKEKEAAMTRCERLQLVAAAALAERSAALKLGDLEEADILLAEAEAADAEATKLQKAYEFEAAETGERDFVSMALIVNLAGKELGEMAASIQPSAV